MKRCSRCKKQKLFSEFHKNPSAKNGLRSECNICSSDYSKKYRQTKEAKQAQNKAAKKYYKTFIGYLRHRFHAIRQRCNNPKSLQYKWYGGRGIKCRFKSSNEFIDYILNELKTNPRGLTIDRIDNDGHYERGNIRFVTVAENNRNRKRK